MAQGTITVFDEFLPKANYSASASDLAAVGVDADSFKIMLISNDIDTITAAQLTPDSADFTEVTGTNYTAGGEVATITVAEAAGTLTITLGANIVWTSPVSGGPADIRSAILYSTTHTGTSDAVLVMDMTTDSGTTPLNLNSGDITINSGTLFTIA